MPAQKPPEQLLQALAKQLDLVMLSRERIQQTLDEAAERGRVTRTDANQLVAELVHRGRVQGDDIVREVERLLAKAKRSIGGGGVFPIPDYADLTATQIRGRLSELSPAELREVRQRERRNANRKTVLEAIDRALGR